MTATGSVPTAHVSSPPTAASTASSERRRDHVRVHFGNGEHADFHWIWLRHQCPLERHATTHERTLSPGGVDPQVQPLDARVEGDVLTVRWQDAPRDRQPSRYPLRWLRDHAYALGRSAPRRGPALFDVEVPLRADGTLPDGWERRLASHGAIVGRRGPALPESTELLIAQIAQSGHRIVETHFGRIEDLRTDNTTNQNTDQLGYTDAAIDLHTDQPFLDHPPRYQLLHAMRAADTGGASLIVDADLAARHLQATDAEAYAILTETKLRFHRKQKAFEREVVAPLLARRPDGSHVVRSSYFTLAPFDVPFAKVEGLYRALRRFEALIHDEAFLLRFVLEPGDLVIYDNHRMLHGRDAFSGPRWVRGVYFDPEVAS